MTDRKSRIIDRFSASAATYDRAARAQHHFAQQLADIIAAEPLANDPNVLEIGCGTGVLSRYLLDMTEGGQFLFSDLSAEMVARAQRSIHDPRARFAIVDGEAPDGVEPGFDLITSNLTVQWFQDLPGSLHRLAGLLKPGGRMVFTTLGADSFREWRKAHDDLGLSCGIPDFPEAAVLSRLLPDIGGGLVTELKTVYSATDALDFARSFRETGASVPVSGHKPLTPAEFRRLSRHMGPDFDVTYHVLVGDFIKGPEPA